MSDSEHGDKLEFVEASSHCSTSDTNRSGFVEEPIHLMSGNSSYVTQSERRVQFDDKNPSYNVGFVGMSAMQEISDTFDRDVHDIGHELKKMPQSRRDGEFKKSYAYEFDTSEITGMNVNSIDTNKIGKEPIPFIIQKPVRQKVPWYLQRKNQVSLGGIFLAGITVIILFLVLDLFPSNDDKEVLVDNCDYICSLPQSSSEEEMICRYIDVSMDERLPCDEFQKYPNVCSIVFQCTTNT